MADRRKREAVALQNQRAAQRGNDPVDASSQIQPLDVGVKLCAGKYNEAKAQADKLEDEVKARSDELIELQREATALHEMLEGNNADSRRITQLYDDIQEANACSDESLLYRHQLNHMHHRVRKNSVTMDGHIDEMSATLSTLQKERDRSQKMLAEVESGLTFASLELDETIRDTNMAEKERIRELATKQLEASDAARMEEWNRDRVNSNIALHQSHTGTDKFEAERLQRSLKDRAAKLKDLNKSMEAKAVELSELEGSFSHVKQATGVNSLSEMVDKIKHHEENQKQLLKEKKDAEDRLHAAKRSLRSDEEALEKLKTGGFGITELNRDIIDDIKSSILDEKSEGKIIKSTNERLEALLVGLRQGSIGLYNRLLPYHSTLLGEEAPALGDIDSINAVQAASDTLEAINFTEKVLGKMLLDIGGIRYVDSKSGVEKDGRPDSPSQVANCRVKPKVSNGCVCCVYSKCTLPHWTFAFDSYCNHSQSIKARVMKRRLL